MEPKSRQQIFVGYDDGSKSIKYYNVETHRVLNFRFLSLYDSETPPEPDALMPTVPGEGESGNGTQSTGNGVSTKPKGVTNSMPGLPTDINVES